MAAGEAIEREIKLAIPDADALDRVAEAVHAGPPVQQTNVFFDTSDGALAAARHGLRLRLEPPRAEVTLKGPNSGRAGAAVRREIGAPVAWESAVALARGEGTIAALPCAPVAEARRLVGSAGLAPRLRFTNLRRTAQIRIAGADCEVCCDTTTFPDDSVEYELEVEVPDAATLEAADRWCVALLARLGIPLERQRRGKASRAARKADLR